MSLCYPTVPRDRNGTFEPQLIQKNQTRFDGFDEKIISLYARGMTTREIQGHLAEIYGIGISPAVVSSATEAVLEEVRAWQTRPLDAVYPILYLDALIVKVKENGRVINKAVYLVIGVNLQGLKEVLGNRTRGNRRRKVLAVDCHRTANTRCRGCFHCLRGWLERFPRSD